MLERFRRHLLFLNSCVFLSVMIIFSVAVYLLVASNIDDDVRQDLTLLADTILTSIEPVHQDDKNPATTVPDVLLSYGEKDTIAQKGATLQWFDLNFKKSTEKGNLLVNVPFSPTAVFQAQQNPHALVLTRPVRRSGKLMGYLRVGASFSEADIYKKNLLTALVTGIVLSMLSSSLAITWLVRQSLKPMEVSMRKLSQFGADASHELKSPLMAIKTNAAVALKYADEMRPKDQEKFKLILNAADQMTGITSGLLRLASSERRVERHEMSRVDLKALLEDIILELTPSIQSRKMKVSILMKDDDLGLLGRTDDLKIVFKNVIENAIRYSKENGVVSISSVRDGAKTIIEIADDGIGIEQDELPHIFDRFWRSSKARTHTEGGSGLGLSIVESMVHCYGGSIAVKSRLGEGTAFTIAMPSA